jgi:signal peptidase I
MLSQLSQIFEFSPNPFSILFLFVIGLTILLLIIAIFSPKTAHFLRKIKILEEKEKPQTFLTWIIGMILIIRIFQVFFFQLFLVSGLSMYPTFQDNDFLIVDKMSYKNKEPARGDVIVFKFLKDGDPADGKYFIKRLIGLPGERVTVIDNVTTIYKKDGSKVILNEDFVKNKKNNDNTDYTLGEDQYFMMGDNRNGSYDSRSWGPIHKSQISGHVIFEFWNEPSVLPGKIIYND